ncbi:MAG: glycosyltransferase family 2 protein [Acidimicrobiia bacterium]|nr:glycosyltransferase family 2 protein [Actinomycetota bacterium]MBL6925522.1 glycosyltransferase family 2 protein [Acidimicrobiia bacterium]
MPVRNEAAGLAAAVAAVLAQEYEGGIEVCLAVAPSRDDTAGVAAALAAGDDRVSVVHNPAGVTPAGLNAAIRATTAPVVVRVDGHSTLPLGYIATAVATLGRTGAVNVGGVQRPEGTTPFEHAVGLAMASRFGAGDARFHYGGPEGPVDTVYLGVFRRDAIEAVGLYDEALIRNQDYELNWRLREAGGVVWFDPALSVGYRPRSSLGALARQFYDYGTWKRVVARSHPRSLRWRHMVAPLTLLGVLAGLIGGWFWPPLFVMPAAYAVAVVAAAIVVGRSPVVAARLCVVYPTMHLSWGEGFLVGRPQEAS